MTADLDLADLGLDEGGLLLVKHALARLRSGLRLKVRGTAPELFLHLRAWCRQQGYRVFPAGNGGDGLVVDPGDAAGGRWRGASRAGRADVSRSDAVAVEPPLTWGLAARGAFVEVGTPAFDFRLREKGTVWTEEAAALYARAAAAQWDPESAIPWDTPQRHPDEVEDAVVQLMTYLIENETAALIIPARFASQVHPHFREVMQLLAIQAADEARHIEVFTRRATLYRQELGLSTIGGQASLKTLVEEPDFSLASFMLSVLGEGTFLSLLWFLHRHAPDPVTSAVTQLAAQDESRHVAFGLAHLKEHGDRDPSLRGRLAAAVERRHAALQQTAGLNEEVFDALVLCAAGSWEPAAVRRGYQAVIGLREEMHEGRKKRLCRLGFSGDEAESLSNLHTRNFM